jgi:hypothetical protein
MSHLKQGLILIIFFICLNSGKTYGQDSCIAPWPGTSFLASDTSLVWNPDSAYYDTCSSSDTFRDKFCRRAYRINFDWYVIQSPVYDYDTALVYEWTAIDTSFSSLRSEMQSLASQIGHFTLTKLAAYIEDTSSALNKAFIIRFDSLLNVNTVLSKFQELPNVTEVEWNGTPRYHTGVSSNTYSKSAISIWPQPAKKEIFIKGDRPLDKVEAYNSLGKQVKLTTRMLTGREVSIDISKMQDKVLYFCISGQFYKILVLK